MNHLDPQKLSSGLGRKAMAMQKEKRNTSPASFYVQREKNAPWKRTATLYMIVLLALTFSACGTNEPDVDTLNAFVYGQATTQTGSPVSQAKIMLTHYPKGCEDDSLYHAIDVDYTNKSGAYRVLYHVGGTDQGSCFLARLKPPEESKLAMPEPKQFNVQFRQNPPYDSVRVDFILKPSEE